MKLTFAARVLILAGLLLGLCACKAAPQTTETEQPTAAATGEATTSVTQAATTAPTAAATTISPTEEATETQAELTLSRAPAITAALERMAVPADGDVAATVNGEDITLDDLRAFVRLRMENLSSQNDIDWGADESLGTIAQVQSEVLEQLIQMTVIRQGATQLGIVADVAELAGLEHEVQDTIVSSQGWESWDQYLETIGLSDAQFSSILEQSLLVNALVAAQEVPEEAEQVHARHILVTDPDLAADLVGQIAGGADFAQLAQENSIDTSTAADGGDLGWFPRGVMVQSFEDAAFALEPGEVSDVVASSYGYHIIEVLEKGMHPLSDAAREQMQEVAFVSWLQDALASADIQRNISDAVG